MIEIVTASHNFQILQTNLLSSAITQKYQTTVQRGFTNIPEAYNSVTGRQPLMLYVHHDVYLPKSFESRLLVAIQEIEEKDKGWGVIGAAGVRLEEGKKRNIGHIRDRDRTWGSAYGLPAEVDTIDELLLVTKGDFSFDPQFDLHFYGADICMQARLQGRKNYAIDAFCHHNSGLPLGYRSDSFRACEAKFRAKYIDHLPIITTCSMLT